MGKHASARAWSSVNAFTFVHRIDAQKWNLAGGDRCLTVGMHAFNVLYGVNTFGYYCAQDGVVDARTIVPFLRQVFVRSKDDLPGSICADHHMRVCKTTVVLLYLFNPRMSMSFAGCTAPPAPFCSYDC